MIPPLVSPLLSPLLAVHALAPTNAGLNAISTLLLVAGWVAIRRGHWRAHRAAMVAAFLVSAVFLCCYLAYHWVVGHVPFAGQGGVRTLYFVILVTHIILAAAVPVLAIRMIFLAVRGRLDAHRRLGRIALPVWLYVSVTGVVIYAMLYHLYPSPQAAGGVALPATVLPGRMETAVPAGQAAAEPSR